SSGNGKFNDFTCWEAIALCQFLENNQQQMNLMDKAVLELGAGTGLLSIVTSLLGAWVTATDLPDILSNLSFNLRRNTKGRSRYIPQVAALSWGQELERDFPFPSYRYDYVLAADVVYHHDFLEELLNTMLHFYKVCEHLLEQYNSRIVCRSQPVQVGSTHFIVV
uniref:Methyltransferase 21C, AARS1 lysine b n=1 Tax=Poecilia reticulata TaxID=8081 RepID=A0A3P9NWX5_POERE